MYRGPDRLVETLLTHPAVRRLLVVNPFRSRLARGTRRALGQTQHPFPPSKRASLLQPLRLRRHDPRAVHAVAAAYRAYDRRIKQAAIEAGLEDPAVITMSPLVAGFSPLDWTGPVTLYANDDWAAYPGYRRWWPAIDEAYGRVGQSGRRVCAVTQAILARIDASGPRALVPNGIEPQEWLEPGPAPTWFRDLPRPRGVYVGTVDSRIDVESVAAAASTLKRLGGSLALVGPAGDGSPIDTIVHLPVVHVSRMLPRPEVVGLVSDADVCVMPHVRNPLTEAMSPLKLYEYLAAGRPVAATDLPPTREISERVVLAQGSDEFGAAVQMALDLGAQPEPARRDFIASNSWRGRHEQILRLALASSQR